MDKCAICQKEKTLQNLDAQDDDGETYKIRLCDTCWDAIFAIAKIAAKSVIFERQNRAGMKESAGQE